MLNNWKVVKNS